LGSLFPKQPFTVLLTPVLTNGLTKANIILPGAGFAETAGTFVNAEGRWQELRPALVAPGGKQNWEIIAALLGALGQPQSYAGPEAVRAEILALMEEEEVGLSLAQK
ncbi:MAG: molybdopterin-dependent oxidoreductase, partial [Clostridia bacterium]|nr:molybdopterin-dependent oxidoreductase [Clostridia bacterium]